MTQRSAEQITRVLRQREPIDYFGGENSEDEIDAIEEVDSEGSEISISNVESTESESEVEEEQDDTEPVRRRTFIYGRDKYKWCRNPPENRGRRSSNVTIILPKAIGGVVAARTPLQFWSALFTDDMLQIVVKFTNAEIDRFLSGSQIADDASFKHINLTELKAFLGILYLCGVQNSSKVNLSELWSHEFGSTFCRVTMSRRRFEFISCRLRFDDKTTRTARRAKDGLAPIREIWDMFMTNCQNNYNPSEFMTIDEQLLGFRGRFSARVYIKSKPARYGIKIVTMNDAKTFYMYNAIPYTGRIRTEPGESVPSFYVRKLSEPIHNTNRTITCDNWFSSIEIFNKMKREFNLSMVGTLRKNKRQIPISFTKSASLGTARYGYDGQNILLSYCPKKNKVVLVLSSRHKTGKQSEDTGKPEIIDFYNKNKCGTDVFDQMCGNYTCSRISSRWPMRFFLGMLDQAGVNASILYNFLPENEMRNRRQFLKDLALSLIKPHLQERVTRPGLHRSLADNIREIISATEINAGSTLRSDKMHKRKRCYYCKTEKDRKTQYCCVKCKKAVCEEHRVVCCVQCTE